MRYSLKKEIERVNKKEGIDGVGLFETSDKYSLLEKTQDEDFNNPGIL